jgi:hypothetical protein
MNEHIPSKTMCIHWSPAGGYTIRGFAALDKDKERCPWCEIARLEQQVSQLLDRPTPETGACQHDVSKPGCTVTPNGLCAFKCVECQKSWDVDGLDRPMTPNEEAAFNKSRPAPKAAVGCPRPEKRRCNHSDAALCCGGGCDGPCDCECHSLSEEVRHG